MKVEIERTPEGSFLLVERAGAEANSPIRGTVGDVLGVFETLEEAEAEMRRQTSSRYRAPQTPANDSAVWLRGGA